MLLFITDRCPVGCEHCSVDSRSNSPTISDFGLFEQILDWLCAKPEIEVVGISGGEPFIERRGLARASRRLADAGKLQVVYTSGVWATGNTPPGWVNAILARCSSVYLSTDAFHARSIGSDRFVRAAHAIAATGAWIIVQVVSHQQMIDEAEQLLRDAFGEDFSKFAELIATAPLTDGRGANVFSRPAGLPGHMFGTCWAVASPMVRYDGLVTGCCNESVIMSGGPSRLRQRVSSMMELETAVERFHADPLLRAFEGVGLGALTQHPRFRDLAEEKCTSICELCWKMLARVPNRCESDHLIDVIATLKTSERTWTPQAPD